ncbi:hypothetical protein GCM10009528_34110 [Kineococcus aurantiacus]
MVITTTAQGSAYSGPVPARVIPVSPAPATAPALARELLATHVDLRDPDAADAVADLLCAVHGLLTR